MQNAGCIKRVSFCVNNIDGMTRNTMNSIVRERVSEQTFEKIKSDDYPLVHILPRTLTIPTLSRLLTNSVICIIIYKYTHTHTHKHIYYLYYKDDIRIIITIIIRAGRVYAFPPFFVRHSFVPAKCAGTLRVCV
jgi:hypothetical protein